MATRGESSEHSFRNPPEGFTHKIDEQKLCKHLLRGRKAPFAHEPGREPDPLLTMMAAGGVTDLDQVYAAADDATFPEEKRAKAEEISLFAADDLLGYDSLELEVYLRFVQGFLYQALSQLRDRSAGGLNVDIVKRVIDAVAKDDSQKKDLLSCFGDTISSENVRELSRRVTNDNESFAPLRAVA